MDVWPPQVPRGLVDSLRTHINALKQAGPVDYHPHSNNVVRAVLTGPLDEMVLASAIGTRLGAPRALLLRQRHLAHPQPAPARGRTHLRAKSARQRGGRGQEQVLLPAKPPHGFCPVRTPSPHLLSLSSESSTSLSFSFSASTLLCFVFAWLLVLTHRWSALIACICADRYGWGTDPCFYCKTQLDKKTMQVCNKGSCDYNVCVPCCEAGPLSPHKRVLIRELDWSLESRVLTPLRAMAATHRSRRLGKTVPSYCPARNTDTAPSAAPRW